MAAAMTPGAAPCVSVIVPSYNHARYLRECIDSVLAQDHPDVELIVVDDGSTDGSLEILRSYGERLTLLQQRGGRQARARNLGLAAARGELIAFLDSDDRYLPGRISSAVEALQSAPDAAVVWGDYRLIDAQGTVTGEARWAAPSGDFRCTLIAGNPICNATVTLRRQALDEIGGFDERVPMVCDGAAWLQIAARGHRFVHLPQLVLDYRRHGANDGARFAAMTRDRDTALLSAAQAYLRLGVLSTAADIAWLRRVLLRQFCFRAAAWVEREAIGGWASAPRAAIYDALGTEPALRGWAHLQRGVRAMSGRGAG